MKRTILCGLLGLSIVFQTAGCGTLMFSDRQGQPSGRVDPNIVILDGIGLFFFIIPGLVAYAIDFASGAIWLPDDVQRGEGPFFHDRVRPEPVESVEPAEPPEPPEAESSPEPSGSPD